MLERHRTLLVPRGTANDRARIVEVVLVGWHPPLELLGEEAGVLFGVQHPLMRPTPIALGSLDRRVWLLSLDYGKSMGRWWTTTARRSRWLAAIRGAKAAAPGRLLRAHNVPADRSVYEALREAGVDLVGTKDLEASQALFAADASTAPSPP